MVGCHMLPTKAGYTLSFSLAAATVVSHWHGGQLAGSCTWSPGQEEEESVQISGPVWKGKIFDSGQSNSLFLGAGWAAQFCILKGNPKASQQNFWEKGSKIKNFQAKTWACLWAAEDRGVLKDFSPQ